MLLQSSFVSSSAALGRRNRTPCPSSLRLAWAEKEVFWLFFPNPVQPRSRVMPLTSATSLPSSGTAYQPNKSVKDHGLGRDRSTVAVSVSKVSKRQVWRFSVEGSGWIATMFFTGKGNGAGKIGAAFQ